MSMRTLLAAVVAACALPLAAVGAGMDESESGARETSPGYESGGTTGEGARGRSGEMSMFQQLDTNQDGYISASEAQRSAQLTSDFSAVDGDGDGRLSMQEWGAAYGQER